MMDGNFLTVLSEYRSLIREVFGLPDNMTKRMLQYDNADINREILGVIDDLISCGESFYLEENMRLAQANLFLLRFLVKRLDGWK